MRGDGGAALAASLVEAAVRAAVQAGAPRRTVAAAAAAVASVMAATRCGVGPAQGAPDPAAAGSAGSRRQRRRLKKKTMMCRSGQDAVLGGPVGQTLKAYQDVDHEISCYHSSSVDHGASDFHVGSSSSRRVQFDDRPSLVSYEMPLQARLRPISRKPKKKTMSCRSGHDDVLGEPVGQTLKTQRVDHEVAHVGSHVPVPAQTAADVKMSELEKDNDDNMSVVFAPVKSAADVKMSEVEKENEDVEIRGRSEVVSVSVDPGVLKEELHDEELQGEELQNEELRNEQLHCSHYKDSMTSHPGGSTTGSLSNAVVSSAVTEDECQAARDWAPAGVDVSALWRELHRLPRQEFQRRTEALNAYRLQLGIESSEEDDSQQGGPQSSTSRSALTRSGKKHRKRHR
ncbi:unnamed protein product [Prorocentrum cordatum]|uniref:Uncharacterized protein n=1 Tax=Prorocentrum cordatum TaxID=2364126 RepID=A0ABN9XMR2_9DINO|nr:unnamed protein product [Polarella glacialis]